MCLCIYVFVGVCVHKNFSGCKTMSPQIEIFLHFPFSLAPFVYFTCVAAMARDSSILLNKSGDYEHSCLAHNLWGKAFSHSIYSMILPVS